MMEDSRKTSTENPTSDASSSCQTCHDILRAFQHHDSYYEINLGKVYHIDDAKCPTHKPLLLEFRGEVDPNSKLTLSRGIIRLLTSKGQSVRLVEVPYGLRWTLLLMKNTSIPGHMGNGVALDQDWAGIDKVNLWKNRCVASHGTSCHNPMRVWPTRPAWLIDVKAKCVVPGRDCGNYVTLSYRLGRHAGIRVNAELMVKLQEPFILDSPEMSHHVPPIIRHAMYLTSFIGEQYLWADIFCIIHGNSAETAAQLNLMSAIYAGAIVTIVAADGDAQDGIPGLQHISHSRKLQQKVIQFGDERVVVRDDSATSITQSLYYTRGWTYQEYAMSARKILFLNGELRWECQCSSWHEETTLWTELDKNTNQQQLHLILVGVPDLPSLGEVVSEYNRRNLTYDEDTLPAISGLLSVFSRAFVGGFLYGLPEMLFDAALGWRPLKLLSDLRRRRVCSSLDDKDSQLFDSALLPSWSWMGWQGSLELGQRETFQFERGATEIHETIPITTWYTSVSPSGSPLRRIRSTWFETRDTDFKDFTRPLPAGWTRHDGLPDGGEKKKPARYLYPDGCGDCHFKHRSMPGTAWYYPFPVAEIGESTRPFTPEQTPYLFCKTKKAVLWPRQGYWFDWHVLNLCTKSGDTVGRLHLHNSDQMQGFPTNRDSYPDGLITEEKTEDVPDRAVELVAICRSRIWSRAYLAEERRFQHPPLLQDTYKVLWVEWKDGVAYRLAAGDVAAVDWEKLELEDVSLILG